MIDAGYVRSFTFRFESNRQSVRPPAPAMSAPRPATVANPDVRSCGMLFGLRTLAVRTVFPLVSVQMCARRSPATTMLLSCVSQVRLGRAMTPFGDHTSTYSHERVSPTIVAAMPASTATPFAGAIVRISAVGRTSTTGGGGAWITPPTLTE